jgi:hypothetical protein
MENTHRAKLIMNAFHGLYRRGKVGLKAFTLMVVRSGR